MLVFLYIVYPRINAIRFTYSNSGFNVNTESTLNDLIIASGISSNLFFNFKPNWYVGIASKGTEWGNTRFKDYSFGIRYSFNLSRKNRPFQIHPSVAFGYTILSLRLGKFSNENDNLRINDTPFDANNIRIDLRRRALTLQPRLALSLELSRRWDLFSEIGYLLHLKQRDEVYFKEQEGFFLGRKSTTKPLSDNDVLLEGNNRRLNKLPVDQNIYIGLGILLKLKI